MKRLLGLVGAGILLAASAQALEGVCIRGCDALRPSPSPSPRSYDTSPAPSVDQTQRNQRAAEMTRLLEDANRAEANGQLEDALSLLGKALDKTDDPAARAQINQRAAFLRDRVEAAARAARDRLRAEIGATANRKIDGIVNTLPDFDGGGTIPGGGDGFKSTDAPLPPAKDLRPNVEPDFSASLPPAQDLRPAREPDFYPKTQEPPLPVAKGVHFHDVPVPATRLAPRNDPRFPFDRGVVDLIRGILDDGLTTPLVLSQRLAERMMGRDPATPTAMQASSYVDGMVRAYAEGRRQRQAVSPAPSPGAGPVPAQVRPSGAVQDREGLMRRIDEQKAARWRADRNEALAQAVREAPPDSPEAVFEVLGAQYRLTGNPAALNAIRYLQGGRQYGEAAGEQEGR